MSTETKILQKSARPVLKTDGDRSSSFFGPVVQPKLTINQPNDIYEQEADAVAEKVMRMPDPKSESTFFQPKPVPLNSLQRKCSNCEEEEKVQMKGETTALVGFAAPQSVNDVINSGGQSLDRSTRNFMESRFGYDFGNVKIHNDASAHQSSKEINALAYTNGNHLVFGEGQYQPNTSSGKKLLAHELAHVIQQSGNHGTVVQKDDDKKKVARKNLIVIGEGWKGSGQLSKVLPKNGRVIKVSSIEDLEGKLKKIDFPIGTIYFITHSSQDGSLKFGNKEGFVKPADIITKLSNVFSEANAPETIDFRGCSVGKDPAAMNNLGKAIGAKTVIAGNCYAVLMLSTPIKIGGKKITKSSDVDSLRWEQFQELKQNTFNKLGDKKKCVLHKSDMSYFAAGGVFVMLWFNSTFSDKWLSDSLCYNEAITQDVEPDKALASTTNCQLIKVDVQSAENKK
jgi:hypothetical protein